MEVSPARDALADAADVASDKIEETRGETLEAKEMGSYNMLVTAHIYPKTSQLVLYSTYIQLFSDVYAQTPKTYRDTRNVITLEAFNSTRVLRQYDGDNPVKARYDALTTRRPSAAAAAPAKTVVDDAVRAAAQFQAAPPKSPRPSPKDTKGEALRASGPSSFLGVAARKLLSALGKLGNKAVFHFARHSLAYVVMLSLITPGFPISFPAWTIKLAVVVNIDFVWSFRRALLLAGITVAVMSVYAATALASAVLAAFTAYQEWMKSPIQKATDAAVRKAKEAVDKARRDASKEEKCPEECIEEIQQLKNRVDALEKASIKDSKRIAMLSRQVSNLSTALNQFISTGTVSPALGLAMQDTPGPIPKGDATARLGEGDSPLALGVVADPLKTLQELFYAEEAQGGQLTLPSVYADAKAAFESSMSGKSVLISDPAVLELVTKAQEEMGSYTPVSLVSTFSGGTAMVAKNAAKEMFTVYPKRTHPWTELAANALGVGFSTTPIQSFPALQAVLRPQDLLQTPARFTPALPSPV